MKRFICLMIFTVFCCPIFAAEYSYQSLTTGITQASMLKSFKDINRNFHVINKMKIEAKRLSIKEQSIITKYVYGAVRGENTFLLINCYLRGNLPQYLNPKDVTKPLKHRMEYYANDLSASVAKSKLPQNMLLYRGINEKGITAIFADKGINDIIKKPVSEENALILKNKLSNTEFTEKGFMSTAYDINYAAKTKFIFVIKAPKNLQAVLLDGIDKPQQTITKEILVNRGYKWKVTDVKLVKDKYYKIELKLVL